MRALLVTHGFPPESVGGVEQHVEGLARALISSGHEVEVWTKTGRADGKAAEVVTDPGEIPCPVHRVIYRYEGLQSLLDLYRVPTLDEALARFLDQRPPFDVAHVHHLTGLSTGLVAVLKQRRVPVALTLHDYWSICPRGQMWRDDGTACATVEPEQCATCLEPMFGGWIEGPASVAAVHDHAREVLRSADRLIVPSARAVPPFVALGLDGDSIRVVENGVDTTSLTSLPSPAADGSHPLRLTYLGTLIPSKGLDVLIDAVQQLPQGMVELSIHGNVVPYHGDMGFLTRAFQGLTPDDAVTFHGPYRTADLPTLLTRADVVAAPALWNEAFGLTIREALAAGRPVIASAIGGLQDAIVDGQHGYLVPPGDRAALAAAIERLAKDRRLVAQMGAAGRHRARGFGAMAADLVEVYDELVGS